jgi:hypothetical protein
MHTLIMNVEWDKQKEQGNIKKHGISFTTAAKIFSVDKFEVLSNKHNEMRYLAIGEIENHVIAVVYTIRHDNYRIISARKASRQERKNYEEYCYSQIK